MGVVSRARYAEGLEYLARMDGAVGAPSPSRAEVGYSQTGKGGSEQTGGRVTPLQVAATLSAAAAYVNEVVYKTQHAEAVERLEGYIAGLPSGGSIASGEADREQLQRGADRLRRAVGKVLPSAEGRVAILLKRLLECAVGVYEGLLAVRMRSRVCSWFMSDSHSMVERSHCCNRCERHPSISL